MYLDGQTAILNCLWCVYNQVNDFCGKTRKTLPDFLTAYLKPSDQTKWVPWLRSKQVVHNESNPNDLATVSLDLSLLVDV